MNEFSMPLAFSRLSVFCILQTFVHHFWSEIEKRANLHDKQWQTTMPKINFNYVFKSSQTF